MTHAFNCAVFYPNALISKKNRNNYLNPDVEQMYTSSNHISKRIHSCIETRIKPTSVMSYTKDKEPELHLHCAYHTNLHACILCYLMVVSRCQLCGSTEVAIRTIILNDPSSFENLKKLKRMK